MEKAYLIVNFGGPRHLGEIAPFLTELLTDRDVIRTRWPQFCHNLLFSRIAKKRSYRVAHDYEKIGGGSPIFRDTEEVAALLRKTLDAPILTFHRYLTATHAEFIEKIEALPCQKITVFPMFPQFSYATTGSIARWLSKHLSKECAQKLEWCKSYPAHPLFVQATQKMIAEFLEKENLSRSEVCFLFSAHGLPKRFIETGDPYANECESSHAAVMEAFPDIPSTLCYQSKFGRGEWLRPYTEDVANEILRYHQGRSVVVIVPISFTSDHIETLFEIENLYLPPIRRSGLRAYRCPALGLDLEWIQNIPSILESQPHFDNTSLIRP